MYISDFSIKNFRSLKDISITGMLAITIFHGDNNTGKSNILSALEMIFRPKIRKIVGDTDGVPAPTQRTSFWTGVIDDFTDNFFQGRDRKVSTPITFEVILRFENGELSLFTEILTKLLPHLSKSTYQPVLKIKGKIEPIGEGQAEIKLDLVSFQQNKIAMQRVGSSIKFFPSLEKEFSDEQRLSSFESMMGLLTDSFKVIPANRNFITEPTDDSNRDEMMQYELAERLPPQYFKYWLYTQAQSRSGYPIFQEIESIFNGSPFEYGTINFLRENGEELEIMINKGAKRLPISRVGSGLQQILFLFASMVYSKGKIIGIEEVEINLSPNSQRMLFEKIKNEVFANKGLLKQVIVTSHSNYFGGRSDVRCFGVTHDGEKTSVTHWTDARRRQYFR